MSRKAKMLGVKDVGLERRICAPASRRPWRAASDEPCLPRAPPFPSAVHTEPHRRLYPLSSGVLHRFRQAIAPCRTRLTATKRTTRAAHGLICDAPQDERQLACSTMLTPELTQSLPGAKIRSGPT